MKCWYFSKLAATVRWWSWGVDALIWILQTSQHVWVEVFLNFHIYFCGLFQAEKISTPSCRLPRRKRVAQEQSRVTSSIFGLRHGCPDSARKWPPWAAVLRGCGFTKEANDCCRNDLGALHVCTCFQESFTDLHQEGAENGAITL